MVQQGRDSFLLQNVTQDESDGQPYPGCIIRTELHGRNHAAACLYDVAQRGGQGFPSMTSQRFNLRDLASRYVSHDVHYIEGFHDKQHV